MEKQKIEELKQESGKIVEYIHGLGKNMKKENKKEKIEDFLFC